MPLAVFLFLLMFVVAANGQMNQQLNRGVSVDVERAWQEKSSKTAYDSNDIGTGRERKESGGWLGYRADPTDCRRFYQYAQGRWVRKDCPEGTVWNPDITVCDWPRNVPRCRGKYLMEI